MSFNTNLGGEESEQSLPSWISDHLGAKSYIDETTQSTSSPIPTNSSKMDTSSLTKESNVMSQVDLDNLGTTYSFPQGVRLRIPGDGETILSARQGEVAFYEAAFLAGLRFPIHPTIRDILIHYQICPAQLSPTRGDRSYARPEKNLLRGSPEQRKGVEDEVLFCLGGRVGLAPGTAASESFTTSSQILGKPAMSARGKAGGREGKEGGGGQASHQRGRFARNGELSNDDNGYVLLGGKIIRDRREGISYDIDATVCYDVELGTSVAQLRDMIIPMVAEYGEHVSIKFICRYPHRRNGDVMIYKKLPINDDRTLQNVLNIPSRHPDLQHVEIYIVKEEASTMHTSGSHAAMSWADSSRSTLAEEAPGQRMCSLFSQGECIEAGGGSSDNSDEDIDALLTNEANDDFDDDGHEDPNIDVTPEFAKGMVFKDKDAVIRACNWYHVKKNKHYHVVETNKNVWSTRCSHNCPWKLRACLKKQHGFFEISQYPGPHTCLHGMESLDHRNINSTFIAHLIKTQVAEDPGWKIASIVENVKNHSGFTVSYKKAWLGRTKAIAMVFGDWDSSYEKLPRFMRTLELRNPGTAVILETLDLGIMGVRALDRIFWAFRPCIEGFKHCPPVIGIDGTFLYGRYTGVMLIAMAKIVTNNIFPLAFALVESENYRDWSWFIHNVRHLIVPGMEGVTLISDRHAAIISAVKHEWETARLGQPIGIHRYCLRHFKRTNSESAARAYRALCNEDPMKWTLAYDGGYRWGVTTTNDSECYNNVLRGARDLPITSCVEVTLYRLVATFNDKRRQIERALTKGLRYTSKVQAKLEEYQARSAGHHVTICNWASGSAEVVTSAAGITGNHKHAVYLNPPSCDCGKWMIYHYPCSHMLAVCAKSWRQPWHLIDPKYRMDVYAHVYDTSFEPMVHEHYWAAYDGPKIIPHPSRRRDPTSGRPTKRIHNEMDVSRKRQHNHCGICKEQGHDRRLMDTVGSPRPIDDTVLTLQSHHRSTWIWELDMGTWDALACRRCGTGLYDRELDPRVLQYVLHAGFYGVHRLGPIRLDHHALITAFVERWRPETHIHFIYLSGRPASRYRMLPSCWDYLLMVPLLHTPRLSLRYRSVRIYACMHSVFIPPAEEIDRGRLRMSWLRRTFDVLPEHADDVSVQRHARAYILLLIGGACSWGSAVLACMLYRSMCRATKIGQRQIVGALLLLQIWACAAIPAYVRMYRVDDITTGQQPLLIGGLQFPGGPWGASSHGGRTMISCMSFPDYCRVASDIWVSRSPLVCFEVVEWHLPDRVCRQFGLRQIIPVAANTSPELHGIDMRGRARTDWTQLHGEYIDHWHHRREYLVVGVIDAAAMRYDDPYMVWYRRITRTLVGNPAHRPTSGYVEIGSTIEIATRYIAAIHDRIDRAIYAYDRPESLQDMYDARDMCSRSLPALREHERIGQPGVPEPPPTIPPVVPAASPAMPPAFLVHSLPACLLPSSSRTHDVPSSSRPSSSGIRPRRTTHRHITSPVTYDLCSSFSPVGDDDEFDVYVDPLLASRGQMEIPVSIEGVSQITQVELQRRPEPEPQPEPQPQPQPQPQPHRLGTLTHVFSRRPRPSRDRRPPRCGTGGHV
ncbi:hypothetical protein Acr_22g0007170 [Actinidia rufa]|uniref:SWIM-type domain-containing protein n=1 Tax=Actinidia rufa TaxID=165716 RepID=A0A7J0GKH8_9ERIC|nr:hypothetical protein Acr_22g0007170 [Actinidia rufa]